MDKIGRQMHGISLHYYTCTGWNGPKGSATQFDTDQYYWALGKCLEIEEVIKKHKAIMDEKDPQNRWMGSTCNSAPLCFDTCCSFARSQICGE